MVTLIPGDGIGPEVAEATVRAVEATGVKIEWERVDAGRNHLSSGQTGGLGRARSHRADGKRWRYLGRFGEPASHSDADEGAAQILDKVRDGMCVRR